MSDVDDAFAEVMGNLNDFQADAQNHAEAIQNVLSQANLPGQVIDATTLHIMSMHKQLADDAPKSTAPPALFTDDPYYGITHQQKRDFLRKVVCAKNPHAAFESGNPALIAYAQKFNPESVQAIRQELVTKLQDAGKKIDYRVKLQLAGVLGGAALPSQDPRIGAGFQANISAGNEANSQEGQAASARQNKAISAQQKGMVTKAQRLGAAGDAQVKEEQGK